MDWKPIFLDVVDLTILGFVADHGEQRGWLYGACSAVDDILYSSEEQQ